MLREIKGVKQEAGLGRRRWFESDGLDVIVWFDAAGNVTGFQLCYDLNGHERALTWRAETGFAHSTIDSGDETPMKNQTPILLTDRRVPWTRIARLFDECSAGLETPLRDLIVEKLARHRRGAES